MIPEGRESGGLNKLCNFQASLWRGFFIEVFLN
jgi:hypothetical protein